MIDFLRKRKIPVMIILDALIVAFSEFFALMVRFEFDPNQIPFNYFQLYLKTLPLDIIITVVIFFAFKLYHGVWTYFSLGDVKKVATAAAASAAVCVAYRFFLQILMPRSFYVLSFCFTGGFAMLMRMSVRIRNSYMASVRNRGDRINTMIIGAGSAGNLLMNEFATNKACQNRVMCLIDGNPDKQGKYVQGVKIVGGTEAIPEAVKKYSIEEIIIAIPSAGKNRISAITEMCNQADCRVRILPQIASTLHGNLAQNIRDINVHDIIGRDPVPVNREGLSALLREKTVLVTGGGGSIGSELCRQIMAQNPKKLIIFDIYENNAYQIQKELEGKYGDRLAGRLEVLIGSVRDYNKLKYIFEKYRPDMVYHAAAHKHVPLMEDSPCEAIKNNCMGTYHTAMLADEYGVKDFVLISTDKAVRPTNVMGASKRICEMIIQSFAKKSKTKFVAVRFGNVLGSNGSVVPLFLKQIDDGGPVTVTHKEITRFFMTIPEAVSLVLQASIYAGGGEIFVLDMGRPVKIYELAKSLIRQKGFRPDIDIKIDIVGLRPGEKLYEEILMDEEGLKKTPNQLIFVGQPLDFDAGVFEEELSAIIVAAGNNDPDMKEKIKEICPTYTITENLSPERAGEGSKVTYTEPAGKVISIGEGISNEREDFSGIAAHE